MHLLLEKGKHINYIILVYASMKSMSKIKNSLLIVLISAALLMAGCDGEDQNSNGLTALMAFLLLPPPCPDIITPAGTTVVTSVSVRHDGEWYSTYMLRIEYAPAEASFAMWIPPRDGGIKPAVLMTNPYDGIRWNGDDPPSYVAVCPYERYLEDANIFLINGFGVLHVFGRFYTGGNLQNDVDDMVAGLRFLMDSGLVDSGNIGIWGASWGGFEALYGAANAPAGAVPAAGVAFYPPSDFVVQEEYFNTYVPGEVTDPDKRNYYIDFFDEYVLRMHNTAGWESWTADALIAKLSTPFLVIHDEWDTLVPVTQSQYLVAHPSEKVKPVWFYQDVPVDLNDRPYSWGHGELREYQFDGVPPAAFLYGMGKTMATAFIINRLAAADQPVVLGYDINAMNDFIMYIRYYTCVHGNATEWAAERLRDIVDARVFLIDLAALTVVSGAEAVAQAFAYNDWGGAAYRSSATIAGALSGGLPACP